ncbi:MULTISPECIES: hypothetical protein [Winslowiella]|uniref:hypothetical protein n=1 Tax=Winslowiella TaxID=2997349 RepID=UPI0028BEE0C9|nr:hypothetical protein [Winslowiella toletana]WNN44559.1 hypothetical protein RIN69_01165 [Winslowiella toletana]
MNKAREKVLWLWPANKLFESSIKFLISESSLVTNNNFIIVVDFNVGNTREIVINEKGLFSKDLSRDCIVFLADEHTLPIANYYERKYGHVFKSTTVMLNSHVDTIRDEIINAVEPASPVSYGCRENLESLNNEEYFLLRELLRGRDITSIANIIKMNRKSLYSRRNALLTKLKVPSIFALI